MNLLNQIPAQAGPIRWAFNSASIMPCPWEQELRLLERYGWSAAEIWYSKMEPLLASGATLPGLAAQMRAAGVEPIGMCAGMLWTSPQRAEEAAELAQIERLLEASAAMQVPALTVVIIGDPAEDLAEEYNFQVEKLLRVAEMGGRHGVRISLEFLGGASINGTMGSAIDLIKRVDHPSLGMLFDFCHYYTSASHLEELPSLPPGKLFAVHVDDSQFGPMESLKNDARCFPGEGRIDIPGMIRRLQQFGYDGYFTVELYDSGIWQLEPADVMERLKGCLEKVERDLQQP